MDLPYKKNKLPSYNDAVKNNRLSLNYSPFYVYLELTNICNLSCGHCPNKSLVRPRGYMSPQLVLKSMQLLSEAQVEWAYLFHVGESALHPNISQVIQVAHAYDIKVRVHTNGTVDISKWAKDVDALFVSANNGLSKHIKENIEKAEAHGADIWYSSLDGLSSSWGVDEKKKIVKHDHFWQGHKCEIPGTTCPQPYKCFTILWDGRCVPCCADYEGKYIIGDINKADSLSDIWNGWEMQNLRSKKVYMPNMCHKCPLKDEK